MERYELANGRAYTIRRAGDFSCLYFLAETINGREVDRLAGTYKQCRRFVEEQRARI